MLKRDAVAHAEQALSHAFAIDPRSVENVANLLVEKIDEALLSEKIKAARKIMRETFAADPGFKQVYISNVAARINDVISGVPSAKLNELAENLIDLIFGKPEPKEEPEPWFRGFLRACGMEESQSIEKVTYSADATLEDDIKLIQGNIAFKAGEYPEVQVALESHTVVGARKLRKIARMLLDERASVSPVMCGHCNVPETSSPKSDCENPVHFERWKEEGDRRRRR